MPTIFACNPQRCGYSDVAKKVVGVAPIASGGGCPLNQAQKGMEACKDQREAKGEWYTKVAASCTATSDGTVRTAGSDCGAGNNAACNTQDNCEATGAGGTTWNAAEIGWILAGSCGSPFTKKTCTRQQMTSYKCTESWCLLGVFTAGTCFQVKKCDTYATACPGKFYVFLIV